MDPKNRSLLKIKIDNPIEVSNLFIRLMGPNVEYRKQFIKENAKFVKKLDI